MKKKYLCFKQGAILRCVFYVCVVCCVYLLHVPLLFAGVTLQERERDRDTLQWGMWEVIQVRLEKNTDGIVQTARNNTAMELNEGVRFPQKLEIKESRKVVLYYDDSKEGINAEYTLEEGEMKIMSVGIILQYRYSINNEQLTLAHSHRYADRRTADKVEDVSENWTVTLERKVRP